MISLEDNEITGWLVAKEYKRGSITASAFISALASLTSVAIVFAYETNSIIELRALFVLRGIQYAFAFHTMLYAFYCNVVRVDGGDKALVNIGFLWMVATLAISLAATFMYGKEDYYDDLFAENLYNVIVITMLSSWGFIAVILLLYIRNNQHFNVDSGATVVIYIFLVIIQAVTTTIIMFSSVAEEGVHPAVVFFLTDLTMDIAIILATSYGPVWIGDKSGEKIVEVNRKFGDLEANRRSK
ncbi:hypothetical protein MFLAVUS_003616 [Mucor flavus]|uniref:Chitin synthase export chaperone n=1 Tax=Mucor flavus TaxID=439312 RepID=A0ABP9YTK6_9FUNG